MSQNSPPEARRAFSFASLLALVVGIFALTTGCNTRTQRIRENGAAFTALSEREQQVVRRGLIQVGFTREMVTMALGKPSDVDSQTTADGALETWKYRNFIVGPRGVVELPINHPDNRHPAPTIYTPQSTGPGPTALDLPEGVKLTVTLLIDFVDNRVAGTRIADR